MDITAIAKTGVHIYRIKQEDVDSSRSQVDCEPIVSLPPAGSAFGYAWKQDGSRLATCDQGKTIVWDPANTYKQVLEIAPVGESGGARALLWSPRGSFLLTFEKFDKDKCPENMHVFDMRCSPRFERIRSLQLRSYTSGAITADLIQWTPDETLCCELVAGEGIVVLNEDVKAGDAPRKIAEPMAAQFAIAPSPQKDGFYIAVYVPEACNSWGAWDLTGRAGEVAVYHVGTSSSTISKVTFQTLPRKLNDVSLLWNSEGTALLAQANSDVDETGESYFGTSSLFWIKADGKAQAKVSGPEDGLVQDVAWAPGKNEFLIIIGNMPATTKLYDGSTGKMIKDGNIGTTRRNTIRWNPFGRFFVVGGFGALPGDLDFFDRPSGETLSSFRANLTVQCCWAPSGRHFLTCTTAPRMNEDNQLSVWNYNSGDRLLKVDFKPQLDVAGGGRKAADAGAMLWAASWRPDGKFKDRAASPPPKGVKRVKGLPVEASSGGGAWRVKGVGGGNSITAAMMRGEIDAPPKDGAAAGDRGWSATPQLSWLEEQQQMKDLAKQKKAAEKQKKQEEEEAKEAEKAELRAMTKKLEGGAKRILKIKEILAELDKLKDKDWDELTEEDEAELEKEVELRTELAELENKVGTAN
jgi:translation initiation factor 2A